MEKPHPQAIYTSSLTSPQKCLRLRVITARCIVPAEEFPAMFATSKKQIVIYLVLLFLFSSVFYFLILHAGTLRAGGGLYVRGLMWCPALAAFATLRLDRRNFSELGWLWGFPNPDFFKQAGETLGLPGPAWISVTLYILLFSAFGLVGSLASALGEEIGWRGFLVPELARNFSFTTTAFISG